MRDTSCAVARSLLVIFLFGLLTMAVVAVPAAAQQDTTAQAPEDSVSRQDTVQAASDDAPAAADTTQVPADSLAQPDTTARTAIDSVATADSAAIAGEAGTDSAAVAQRPAPPPITYEESQLQVVAQVLVAIEELRRKYHDRQGLPEDSLSGGRGLHAEFEAEVTRVFEQHGITKEFYSEVIRQARERPALRKQLLEHAAAVRE